jgi:hypothetical protein
MEKHEDWVGKIAGLSALILSITGAVYSTMEVTLNLIDANEANQKDRGVLDVQTLKDRQAERKVQLNNLNLSAIIIDNSITVITQGILSLIQTVESPKITLSAGGDLALEAAKQHSLFAVVSQKAAGPTNVISEVAYTVQLAGKLVSAGALILDAANSIAKTVTSAASVSKDVL